MNAHLIRMIQLALVDRSTSAAHRDLLARLRQRLEGFQQERPQA
jgi:hypothetical protein